MHACKAIVRGVFCDRMGFKETEFKWVYLQQKDLFENFSS